MRAGRTTARSTFETGDPNLDIERANSLEGSVRVALEKTSIEGSLWGARFSDYILGALTGRTCDDEGNCVVGDSQELKELNYTPVDATFWGAEGKLTVDLYENARGKLQTQFFADYVRATIDDGGGNIPRIPPYHVGAGLHWDGGPIDGGVFVRYSGRQDEVGTAETPTPGFTSVDAHFGWRPWSTHPDVELMLVGHNLTDSTHLNAVALNKDEVILPGRDLRLTVRAAF